MACGREGCLNIVRPSDLKNLTSTNSIGESLTAVDYFSCRMYILHSAVVNSSTVPYEWD